MTTLERFWSKVIKRGPTECWLWKHPTTRGYGRFFIDKHVPTIGAHRYSWMLHNERDVPAGLYVCHRCDTPPCVNPAHLFLGTAADNWADAVSKDRHARGERAARSRLTAEWVVDIRRRYAAGGVTQTQLAEEFGVTHRAIGCVVLRQTWRHVS